MTIFRSIPSLLVIAALYSLRPLSAATPEFFAGVCTHFAQPNLDVARSLTLIKNSGANSIRDDIAWAQVEKQKGQYSMPPAYDRFVEQSIQDGLQPLLILDYGNPFYDNGDKPTSPAGIEGFAKYAEFVAAHFKGRIHMYEVFNEWDGKVGHTSAGTAQSYINLLQVVSPRLKRIDPSISVLGPAVTSGGLANGWIESFLAGGGTKWLDGLSVHAYSFYMGKTNRTPAACINRIASYEAMARKYNGDKIVPIYVTEVGYPTFNNKVTTPSDLSGDYLAQLYILARTLPFLKGIWWYEFQDGGTDPNNIEHNFGIVSVDFTPKPGYDELKEVAKLVETATSATQIDLNDPEVATIKLTLRGGNNETVAWRNTEETKPAPVKEETARQLDKVSKSRASVNQSSGQGKPVELSAKPKILSSEK